MNARMPIHHPPLESVLKPGQVAPNITVLPQGFTMVELEEHVQIELPSGLLVEINKNGSTVGVYSKRADFDAGHNPVVGVIRNPDENAFIVGMAYDSPNPDDTGRMLVAHR